MLGKRRVVISSVELLNEVCDEKRFGKVVTAALNEVRNATGDGLFTAVSLGRVTRVYVSDFITA
jgi:cytochrome P450/NADPH-cytochrome P450 reductase